MRLSPAQPAALALTLALAGCGENGSPDGGRLSPQAALGERIFNDASLSASGRQSCSSCHVAAAGDAQDNALAAQLGGADFSLQGSRTAPSIRYPAFRGRASSDIHQQVRLVPGRQNDLSAAEARGLAAFEDPLKGNCSSCHTSARGRDGTQRHARPFEE
jgi:cytochrome c peroxidase